jgi:hypothetical protein
VASNLIREILKHKLSLLSATLSVTTRIAIGRVVDYFYVRKLYVPRSELHYTLGSLQGAIAFISILIAVLALRREPRPLPGFVALGLGFLLMMGATV